MAKKTALQSASEKKVQEFTHKHNAKLLLSISNSIDIQSVDDFYNEIENVIHDEDHHSKYVDTVNDLIELFNKGKVWLAEEMKANSIKLKDGSDAFVQVYTEFGYENIFDLRLQNREIFYALVSLLVCKNPTKFKTNNDIFAAMTYFEAKNFFDNIFEKVKRGNFDAKLMHDLFLLGSWSMLSKASKTVSSDQFIDYLHSVKSKSHRKKRNQSYNEEIGLAKSAWNAGCELNAAQMAQLLKKYVDTDNNKKSVNAVKNNLVKNISEVKKDSPGAKAPQRICPCEKRPPKCPIAQRVPQGTEHKL